MTVNENLSVSSSPHILTKNNTRRVMLDVLIALLPAVVASVIFYGWRALVLTAVCVLACNLFEFGFTKLTRRPTSIFDLSASVTGVLLSQNLSATFPICRRKRKKERSPESLHWMERLELPLSCSSMTKVRA